MDWAQRLTKLQQKTEGVGKQLEPAAMLLVRVTLGGLFLSTGWGKIHHLDKVTSFFVELHIPMPALNAFVVGWSEFLCGAALLLGLLSRLATIPLIVSMIVALITAKKGEILGSADGSFVDRAITILTNLFGEIEFTYLVMLIVVAVVGPGLFSLDHAIVRSLKQRAHDEGAKDVPGGPVRHGT